MDETANSETKGHESSESKSEELTEIHTLAKERFKEIEDFESIERDIMLDDKAFAVGENNAQWDPDDANRREGSGRTFITIMRSNQFTDYVKNQQRQNKPSVRISPTDEGANEEEAKRRQGLIRKIQYESKASQARQAGFDDAVDEGRGHWIVKTQFVPGTFNKEITIEPIRDSQSVYMDWRRQRPDYSDCEYGFLITKKPRKEFEKDYPDITLSQWQGAKADFWYSKDDVTIAEYYCKMYKARTLVEVEGIDDAGRPNTRKLWLDEIKEPDSVKIIQQREAQDPYWMWYKMTGLEIVDSELLPWKEIPIITVIGKENIVSGKWSCKGLIRDIKAPLRLYNFVSSNEADIIAKAPRAPWVGAEGQFEGHEQEYADSNTSDVPYLEYKPVTIGGQQAPPPHRAQYSVDLSNISQQKMAILEDIKAITGLHDPSLGINSAVRSGVAIKAEVSQGNTANFHYIDNYAMAINHEGRVINSALHIIYDTKRTVTTRNDNEEESLLKINHGEDDGFGPGNFNTTVSVGPSFNTQREEQAAGMLELLSVVPLAQNVAADLVVRCQDWIGKDDLADRLKYAIEKQLPGITTQQAPKDGNEQLILLQQQLAQCQDKLGQATQQAQQMGEALQKSDADKNAAAAGKVEIDRATLQLEVKRLELEAQKIQGEMELEHAKLELEAKKVQQDMLKADLSAETTLKISHNTLEVDLIKTESSNNARIKELHTAKMLETPDPVEPKAPEEKEPVVVNIHPATVKRSKIIKVGDGYEVVTREESTNSGDNDAVTVNYQGSSVKKSKIIKVGDGYEVETSESE